MKHRLVRTIAAGVLLLGAGGAATVRAGSKSPAHEPNDPLAPLCHNNTHNRANHFNDGFRLSGDPNVGLPPAPRDGAPGGYYYLDVIACGSTLHFQLQTCGTWGLQVFRVANQSTHTVTDFASVD